MDTVARVDALLGKLGLGRFDWPGAEIALGRNDNWAGATDRGHRVFVKHLTGPSAQARRRMAATSAFYAALPPDSALRAARLLGQDERGHIQVFECLADSRSGTDLALTERFDEQVGAEAGRAIGALHQLDPTGAPAPPVELDPLRGLRLTSFLEASYAQLEAWSLLQHDRLVTDTLTRLASVPARHLVAVHGDLRLDQFLLSENRLYLTDWEEFQLGDPARDVGAFAGEWLYRAIIGHLTEGEPGKPVRPIVLTPRWAPLARLRPVLTAFWRGYRELRDVPAGLTERAVCHAAWQLLERLFMDALHRPRLDGAGHTLFEVARTVLAAPTRFVPVLGLED